MTFGLIAIALVFLSVALLLLSKGQDQQSREIAQSRLDRALSHSLDPLQLQNDPLKKKYVPRWLSDNLISAGLRLDKPLAFKLSAVGVLILLILLFTGWVLAKQRKRKQLMLSQLPAFLDGVVRVSAVGYSLTVSFNTALENAEQPLRDALGMAVQMQYAGLELDQSMHRLARVYGLSEFKLIASVVTLALNYGGKSDILLSRLAQYLRDREQHHKELMAMSSEARTSAMFMCALVPALAGIILALNPAYLSTMWQDGTGRLLLIGAGVLQTTGAIIIYRMVKSL